MHKLLRCCLVVGLVGVFALSAVPASADAESDAGDAIERYVTDAFAGEWAKTYDQLPTAQRDLLSESDWEACQDRRNGDLVGVQLDNLKVVGSKKERYRLPGADGRVPALAVTIQITATLDGKTQQERDTVHVVREGKRWRPSVRRQHLDDCLGT